LNENCGKPNEKIFGKEEPDIQRLMKSKKIKKIEYEVFNNVRIKREKIYKTKIL
jgi:hypothetical protein